MVRVGAFPQVQAVARWVPSQKSGAQQLQKGGKRVVSALASGGLPTTTHDKSSVEDAPQ
jgi:hypothetical protein